MPGAGEKQYKFEEILPIYKAVSDETDTGTYADFMEAFKTFDREGQGFISSAEMRMVLVGLGTSFTFASRSIYNEMIQVIHAAAMLNRKRGLSC